MFIEFAANAGKDWKPAGILADHRAVAALGALLCLEAKQFVGIGGCWTACLLQKGRIFQRRADSRYFVSLGFQDWAALGWELDYVADRYFVLPPPALPGQSNLQKLQVLVNTDLGTQADSVNEEFVGVPFKLCGVFLDVL